MILSNLKREIRALRDQCRGTLFGKLRATQSTYLSSFEAYQLELLSSLYISIHQSQVTPCLLQMNHIGMSFSGTVFNDFLFVTIQKTKTVFSNTWTSTFLKGCYNFSFICVSTRLIFKLCSVR